MEWELQVGGVVDLEDVLSLARRVGDLARMASGSRRVAHFFNDRQAERRPRFKV
jgi:hypothetical protein